MRRNRLWASSGTLAAVDAKLAAADSRLVRIEQHLGIQLAASAPDPNHPPQVAPTAPKPTAQP
jgi:hypothetical protein